MPEGDSVYQLAARLQFMVGREITYTSIRVPRYATATFTGEVCERVWPYGKHLFMQFGNQILHTHLKMDGTWAIHRAGSRWRKPGHQARVVLRVSDHPTDIELVGFLLGHVAVYGVDQYSEVTGYLGPDILAPEFDIGTAVENISADPSRSIGEALLDQRNLAGIGNEYRAEICFVAGINPFTPVGDVDVVEVLRIARSLIWANRNSSMRVTTGVKRAGENNWVFGREGRPCRKCGTPIAVDRQSEQRIVWWCPSCQS